MSRDKRNTVPRGERTGASKLTAEQVIEIWRLLQDGEKQREIARQFGVAHVTVGAISRRETWTHITDNLADYDTTQMVIDQANKESSADCLQAMVYSLHQMQYHIRNDEKFVSYATSIKVALTELREYIIDN